jgi:hypothetical protein
MARRGCETLDVPLICTSLGRGSTRRPPRKWACHAGDFTDHQSAARSVCRFLAGDGDDAVPDDRGTAADADLGDLAVLLAGSGVEQAGAVHGDALIDPQMKAAVSLW